MPRINVFGVGLEARSSYISAKRMVNMLAEPRPSGEKSGIVGFRTPGLVLFADAGMSPARGAAQYEKNGRAYCVILNAIYEITGPGSLVNRGTLLTNGGRVSMACGFSQVMVVDGTYGYILNTTTNVFTQIVAAGFPANPTTVTFCNGHFVVSTRDSSRFNVSAQDDGLTWNALDFANAESSSDPIVAVWANGGQLVLFGTRTTEYWGASGAADFPFSPIQGVASEWGLASPWSLAKFDNTVAGLFHNRMGQVMVASLNGYLPKRISTPDVDFLINRYVNLDRASGYSYMAAGHSLYALNFPQDGTGDGFSWMFDQLSGMWSEIKSNSITRHRANFGVLFNDDTLLFDYANGKIYTPSTLAYTDNGEQLVATLVTQTSAMEDLSRFTVNQFRMDVETGESSASVLNPELAVEVSRDNGRTWGAPLSHPLGPAGVYWRYPNFARLGTARNFVFRVTVSDPVPFTLVSACINPDD